VAAQPAAAENKLFTFWMILGSKIPFMPMVQALMVGAAAFAPLRVSVLHTESIKRAFMASVESDPNSLSLMRKYSDGAVRICGLVFGKWYACVIPHESESGENGSPDICIWHLGSIDHMLKSGNREEAEGAAEKSRSQAKIPVRYFTRGSNRYDGHNEDSVSFDKVPTPQQQAILDAISLHAAERKGRVDFIHGPPGTGKSSMALWIAALINPENPVVIRYNPNDPGCCIHDINDMVNSVAKGKAVVVIDEGDELIIRCVKGRGDKAATVPHPHLNTQVTDKSSLHGLLDDIAMLYPNIHLLMTSNRTPKQIARACGGDASTTRNARMTVHHLTA
jgi:hypothetical protein